jgi:N-acetylmuramoyl-L-alanine amidase
LVAKEKNITLSIALEVDSLLKKEFKDLKVILTRKTDVFVELHERANISARNKADFFISIHCNANNNKTIYGSETYAMGLHKEDENMSVMVAENSVILLEENYEEQYEGFDPSSPDSYIMFTLLQNAYLKQSLNLARKIESEFKKSDRTSRGVKQAGFLVLWKAGTPALLIETGFLSNKIEEKYLHSEKGQKAIAQAIVRAIKIYAIELQS